MKRKMIGGDVAVNFINANVKPGDVIIHHPNCVHGSGANVSASKRRLAASLRYVGSETKWKNKSRLEPVLPAGAPK